MPRSKDDKVDKKKEKKADGVGRHAGDALQLTIDYVKQETVEPLKGLGRFVWKGLLGSIVLAVGLVVVLLALLRLLQDETYPHLTGHLSWVPYLGELVAALVVAGIAGWRIVSGPARRKGDKAGETKDTGGAP